MVSTHLPPIKNSKEVNPVMFPPGRAKLGTKPCPTGSATFTKTIGIDGVFCAIAASAGVAAATITSGFKSTNSAAAALTKVDKAAAELDAQQIKTRPG